MIRLLVTILAVCLALVPASTALADRPAAGDEGATHVVAGKVKHVRSYHATNRWGDELILSDVTVKIERTLKGEPQDELVFTVEGGEVGDVVLRVSAVPLFREGDEVVLRLKKKGARFEYLGLGGGEVSAAKAKPSKLPCCKTFASWPSTNVPFYVNPNTQDLSARCVIDEIAAAAGAWNKALGETLLNYVGTTDITAVSAGDANAVFFRNDPGGSTIAVTYIWYTKRGGDITAFDMIFYDSWAFFGMLKGCGTAACSGGFYLQPIAAHEFGHAIGLDHNRCADSLMYPYASYCDEGMLTGYDSACAEGLYP